MKHIYFIVSIILFASLVFLIPNTLAIDITTGCTNITSSGYYSLTSAIPSNNATACACFNITVDDVVLECSNYNNNIIGFYNGGNKGNYGVAIYSKNVTVRNCNISGWKNDIGLLYQGNVQNVTLINLTLYNASDRMIHADGGNNTLIKNCLLNGTGSAATFGILFGATAQGDIVNITIEDNTISETNPSGGNAITFTNIESATIRNNKFINHVTSYTISTGATNLLIENNTFSNEYGIDMAGATSLIITNNTFIQFAGIDGTIYSSGTCTRCNVTNNKIIGSETAIAAGAGIYMPSATGSLNAINNTIINYTYGIRDALGANHIENNRISSCTNGIHIKNANSNLIKDNFIRNNTYGIYLLDFNAPASVLYNIFQDTNISESENYDIYYNVDTSGNGGNINNTFLNVSFSTINVTSDSFGNNNVFIISYHQWYLEVQVVYDNGSYASNANVNVTDGFTGTNITLTTNATGWIGRQNITEKIVQNDSAPDADTINITITHFNSASLIHAYTNNSNISTVNFASSENTLLNLTLKGNPVGGGGGDTTGPVVALTVNPKLITTGGSSTVSCTGTDDVAMASITVTSSDGTTICTGTSSCSAAYAPTTIGTYTITCVGRDTSNNPDTAYDSLQVTGSSGGPTNPGGPGGGGGGVTPINETNLTIPNCGGLCLAFAIFPPEHPSHIDCCSGLTQSMIYDMQCYTETGSCNGCESIGAACCTKCGDGLCQTCENYCNCPDDCPLCANIKLEAEITLGLRGGQEQNIFNTIWEWLKQIFS